MDASYSIFTKFRLKSLVVLFTQSAIFNLPWMLCALSTTNRSFISPCEKISSFYWLAKHWFRCGDSFWKIPSLFLTLTNILILSLKLTTETFLKIFIQSFSRSPLSTSVIVIFLCRFLKRRAKLEENQSDEPVLLAPFCDAYQLTRENEKCFRYF